MNTRIRTMRKSDSSKSSATKSQSATVKTTNRDCKPGIEKHLRESMLNKPPRLFASLSEQARAEVLSKCVVQRYAKGERIIRAGERADELYVIARGRAQATKALGNGLAINFADLERGGHFGEQSLIDDKPHATSITALTVAHVFVMPPHAFLSMFNQHASVAFDLVQQAFATQHELLERIAEHVTQPVDYRIRAESLRMAARHQVMDGGARIPYMTHAKLAGHVGCRREAVSRELKSLERDGIVIKQNRQFVVPDLERLRQRRDEAKR